MVGKRSLNNVFKADPSPDGDIERGLQRSKITRFKDVVDMATAQNQKAKIKKQLTEGVDRMRLEKYRKSDEELKDIKSKRIRNFYEMQNERLDAWLEVDTIVMSMAEDILESMNPDRDRDGIAERNGALQGAGGRLDELLPKDAREERLQGEKNARWAINVCPCPCQKHLDHSNDHSGTGQCHCERASFGCQMPGCLLFFFTIFDCLPGRFSIRLAMHIDCVDNQQARSMADQSPEQAIPSGSSTTGADRYPCFFHYHGNCILASTSGVCAEAAAGWGEESC